ncbi:carbonic anhydrase [Horticoccus sp. 23ND18S-11]|uniref:carbonic anhydrase n=1 Tax=Horticoccus sp. 23ND18S-11 TaxID=3391832 RepID=UPI0039C9DACD
MHIPGKATLLLLVACLPAGLIASDAKDAKPKVSADAALQLLMAGNARFAAGGLLHPDQSVSRRTDLAKGQKPFAIILTCADSRVAPEIYFDQGLGDIFVLRNAGNILNDHTIGSIEYAVEHLGAGLIMVIGHSKCGAVSAAAAGGHAPGHIQSIVESIVPAVKASEEESGDKVENAVRANARMVAAALRSSDPILSEAAKHGHIKVVAARYDLSSGKVEVFDDAKAPAHATVAHAAHAAPAAGSAH